MNKTTERIKEKVMTFWWQWWHDDAGHVQKQKSSQTILVLVAEVRSAFPRLENCSSESAEGKAGTVSNLLGHANSFEDLYSYTHALLLDWRLVGCFNLSKK